MRHIAPFQCLTDDILIFFSILKTMAFDQSVKQGKMKFRHHKAVGIRYSSCEKLHLMSTVFQPFRETLGGNTCPIMVVNGFNNKKYFHNKGCFMPLLYKNHILKSAAKIPL